MVNDINTLNGALTELGETLADNISNKGVSASANDGLTTLVNKIKEIPSSKKTITSIGNFTYGSNINCTLVNDEYWEFTSISSSNVVTSESFIYVYGSDYSSVDDTVIISCKIGAMGTELSQFSFCMIDEDNNIHNSVYITPSNGYVFGLNNYHNTYLSANDVMTIIVHNEHIYVYCNGSKVGDKAFLPSFSQNNKDTLKIVFTCFKNTFANRFKEVSYEIVEGFYSNPLLDSV